MLEPHRSLKLAVCTLTMFVFVGSSSGLAATRTVTNTNDSGPGSLRDAIAAASAGDTIKFNLVYPAEIDLSSTVSITKSLTISGPGISNLILMLTVAGPAFSVNGGVTVAMSGMEITSLAASGAGIYNNGNLNVSDTLVDSFGSIGQLGGSFYNNGILKISNSTVSGNFAQFGGGIYNNNGGRLTVVNSTVSGNTAHDGGGGVFNAGTSTLINSAVSGNGSNNVAGIYNIGTALLTNSSLSANAAEQNGGIYNAGMLTVSSSALSGNISGHNMAGAIVNVGGGTAIILNSTFAGNFSPLVGAIFNAGTMTVTSSTLSANKTPVFAGAIFNVGTLSVKNTILANSVSGAAISVPNCFGTAGTSAGYNLSDDSSCNFAGPGDLENTPAGLDPGGLQNNGGPTQTIALLATSPAVDAIPASFCTAVDGTPIATDQRGIPRPQGLACDIGAYEYLPIVGPAPSSGTTCNGAYNGTFNGNIRVSGGQNCILFNGQVTGNVQQIGGSLLLFQSQVGGNVQVEGGGTVDIGPSSTIDGNLQIQNLPSGAGTNQVCGTNVRGNLQFENNAIAVLIGAVAPVACAGNAIGGNLQVQNNSASTTVAGNTIRGNLQDQTNKGPTQVFFNAVSGNLQCGNNTAIQGGENTASQKQGQCVGF